MPNIVQQTQKKNHVSHSKFDLSGNINFTACPGMLLPLRVDDCLPNSTYNLDYSLFARTVQMVVPSFARVRAHIDTFFVPYRILGTDYQSMIVGDDRGMTANYTHGTYNGGLHKVMPYIDLAHFFTIGSDGKITKNFSYYDACGYSNAITSPILLNALGYGVPNIFNSSSYKEYSKFDGSLGTDIGSSRKVDFFDSSSTKRTTCYLQAYQKIYQDFYRNKLWEVENKGSYFSDSTDMNYDVSSVAESRGLLEMRYKDFDKDRLMGLIPDENGILSQGISQYASTVLSGTRGTDSMGALGPYENPLTDNEVVDYTGYNIGNRMSTYSGQNSMQTFSGNVGDINGSVLVQQYTALTSARMEAFQKFAEVTMLNKNDYKHQTAAHFGFTPSDLNTNYAQFLGGFDVPLNVSDIENTAYNKSDSNSFGYLGGKGTMSGSSRQITVHTSEHGILMSIFYILPQIDWSNEFMDRGTARFGRYDFAIPEFDRLGYEPVRLIDLFGSYSSYSYVGLSYSPNQILGYLPRYWYYKTRLDVNATGFTNSAASLNFDSYIVKYPMDRYFKYATGNQFYRAVKCPPNILDGLFPTSWSSVTTNPFIITCYVRCSATLPLSIDSLPV